jgi:putative protease
MMIKKPELLAPAGSMESLYAAVNSGCDAVYLGGKQFSARQNADNFSNAEIKQAVDYCHVRGVKLLVTINTLYKEKELKDFLLFANELYTMGVDGVIIQDIGAVTVLKENLPNLKLHASTQMTAHSLEDVKYLEANGFERVVLSRELSIEEIANICKNTHVEIECFIHGALCVCYSGQCLLSSMLGGRSGNRGRCAQPCRLKYTLVKQQEQEKISNGYLLSPKDISTIKILPQLIEAGITSFKIEGRMKKPEYVAGVVSIYRKYIDMYYENAENYKVEIRDIRILEQLFNRGGFTDGYFNEYSGSDMMSSQRPKNWGVYLGKVESITDTGRCTIKTVEPLVPGDGIEIWTSEEPHPGSNISKPSQRGESVAVYIKEGSIKKGDLVYKTNDKALMDSLAQTYQKHTRQMNIVGKFSAKIGKEMVLKLSNDEGIVVEMAGPVTQQAQNQPMTSEKISQQLNKTGNTPFKFIDLELDIDDNIYIPVSILNEFRRETMQNFESKLLEQYNRFSNLKLSQNKNKDRVELRGDKKITVLVQNDQQLNEVLNSNSITRIYFELKENIINAIDSIIAKCQDEGIELFAALPRIQREATKRRYDNYINILKAKPIDGYLVRTWGQLHDLEGTDKTIAIDYTFNTFNSESINYWNKLGADTITLSPELNYDEINAIGSEDCETIGYGYLPLMVTHQCPVGNFAADKVSGKFCKMKNANDQYFLKDRLGMQFPILTDCDECISYVLNSQPILLLASMDELIKLPTGALRLQFTEETPEQVSKIVHGYEQKVKNYKYEDDIINNIMQEYKEKGYTKGHYFRGVE